MSGVADATHRLLTSGVPGLERPGSIQTPLTRLLPTALLMIKLFKKRVEWKPPVGSFEPAARGAFRVLGLGAGVAQGEVFDAAASLRLALKVGVRKAFEGDAAWLGEVARKESDVRDAVGRLSEPVQRARERLYWLHLPAPRTQVSTT